MKTDNIGIRTNILGSHLGSYFSELKTEAEHLRKKIILDESPMLEQSEIEDMALYIHSFYGEHLGGILYYSYFIDRFFNRLRTSTKVNKVRIVEGEQSFEYENYKICFANDGKMIQIIGKQEGKKQTNQILTILRLVELRKNNQVELVSCHSVPKVFKDPIAEKFSYKGYTKFLEDLFKELNPSGNILYCATRYLLDKGSLDNEQARNFLNVLEQNNVFVLVFPYGTNYIKNLKKNIFEIIQNKKNLGKEKIFSDAFEKHIKYFKDEPSTTPLLLKFYASIYNKHEEFGELIRRGGGGGVGRKLRALERERKDDRFVLELLRFKRSRTGYEWDLLNSTERVYKTLENFSPMEQKRCLEQLIDNMPQLKKDRFGNLTHNSIRFTTSGILVFPRVYLKQIGDYIEKTREVSNNFTEREWYNSLENVLLNSKNYSNGELDNFAIKGMFVSGGAYGLGRRK